MEVRNCRKCGRIFNYVMGMPICPACRERIEEKFQEVKDYIRENKGAGILKFPKPVKWRHLRSISGSGKKDWYLQMIPPSASTVKNCNATIKTGRFCEKCKASMVNNLKRSIQKPKPRGACTERYQKKIRECVIWTDSFTYG